MADISSDARRAADVVEGERRDELVLLEKERERLADTSGGTEDGDLGVLRLQLLANKFLAPTSVT